jgi:hypothetical protein
MTVPSHNLYDFIHQATEKRFWLLYFYPWGEKDLSKVIDYQASIEKIKGTLGLEHCLGPELLDHRTTNISEHSLIRNFQPVLFCHDQEPLNYAFYEDGQPLMEKMEQFFQQQYNFPVENLNLRSYIVWSWQKQWILLHSEINSPDLDKYESTGRYVGAYWWSHAMLARDWYRYAEHDKRLSNKNTKNRFLIYCRDTTGTRSYRKVFFDKLAPGIDYHRGNPDSVDSDASAYYHADDFIDTDISVVLETLFDDRIHLTEKILRSIAVGHPFILAAGPGSLSLLKKYGFKTFSPWIDESYDNEANHEKRLDMIVNEINRIQNLDPEVYKIMIADCQAIAQHNRDHFFSQDFLSIISQELITNVNDAYAKTGNRLDPSFYWKVRQWRKFNIKDADRPTAAVLRLVRHLRLNQGSFEQYQRHQHSLDDESSTNGDDV